jgi:CRISPR/Cas system-associated exonuclease Cas4 (RecB family)
MSEGDVRIVVMENGTYQKTEAGFSPIVATAGYWVAVEETTEDGVEVGETVGVWTDKTGKVWFDRVIRLSDLTKALALGKMFSQLAIYDVANKKEIEVK